MKLQFNGRVENGMEKLTLKLLEWEFRDFAPFLFTALDCKGNTSENVILSGSRNLFHFFKNKSFMSYHPKISLFWNLK